jgi:hypothetical protein
MLVYLYQILSIFSPFLTAAYAVAMIVACIYVIRACRRFMYPTRYQHELGSKDRIGGQRWQ